MEGRIRLVEVEISAGDSVVYLHGEDETSEDFVQPDWWSSADLVHCDSNLIDPDKVVILHQSSVWRDLDLSWPNINNLEETGNTVVFADFKSSDDTK